MAENARISVKNLDLYYGNFRALRAITMDITQGRVTALIGPSGCGKSSFLRTLNRMNDLVPGARIQGTILMDDKDIYAPDMDVVVLRKRVGMVFQRPNPFPMSIYDNVAYGPRIHGERSKAALDDLVESSLRGAALWEEVKDRLNKSALGLSGGQQQRLCIARSLAVRPEVLLMDEPASALDPISTAKIEDLIRDLRNTYTIAIVTHNMQQAARVSDYTAFFLSGELVEHGATGTMFTNPKDQRTEDYITGRFGQGTRRTSGMARHTFHEELEQLQRDLLKMGTLVSAAIENAVASLAKVDVVLARQVIDGDDTVDQMMINIEKRCLELMALQQPLAKDLRTIGTALKIVTDLERMADHAVDIAKVTVRLEGETLIKELIDIPRMAQRVQTMIREALEAYVQRDVEHATRMIHMDDEIDRTYNEVFEELMGIMQAEPSKTKQATYLLLVALYLERVGDHATNLGEWTIYMVTGELKDMNT